MISSALLQIIRKYFSNQVSLNLPLTLKTAMCLFCMQLQVVTQASADTKILHEQDNIKEYGYEVVNVYPHDPKAFTQGLIYKDGYLYESTGLFGQSSLRKVELESGKVLQVMASDKKYFSEGLATNKQHLIQLSWRAGQGFIYDLEKFELTKTFNYPGEGWGLTHHNKHFILSDGSSYLRFLDEHNMQESGRVQVIKNGKPVTKINELEMVNGFIFANVWQTDQLLIISPETGRVSGIVDLTWLLKKHAPFSRANVLNGIAYDAKGDRLFVTGKLWPKLFEIRLILTKSNHD